MQIPTYTLPYLPHLPPSTPTSLPYSIHHTTPLPNVNDALSRVEHDLKNLTYSLSHPHTLNNPTSYNRTRDITTQIENLSSIVGTLKQKMTTYENSPNTISNRPLHVSPIPRQQPAMQSPKNVRFSHNIISPPLQRRKPANPYIKKRSSSSNLQKK